MIARSLLDRLELIPETDDERLFVSRLAEVIEQGGSIQLNGQWFSTFMKLPGNKPPFRLNVVGNDG